MIPVAFDGCAGFLHLPEAAAARGRGVVICQAIGYEGLCTQRPMLTLASMMAEAGLPTLRFHYPGTGDSAGDETPDQIDRWIDSIGAAIRFLKETSGVTEVALCGFRLGGLLAIEAARRFGGICALALLAPVLQGRSYVRELILSGSMIEGAAKADADGWHEILGYRLHAMDLERLRGIDLSRSAGAGAALRILLISPQAKPAGIDPSIEFRPFLHYDGLTQHTQHVVTPVRVFGETVGWLLEGAPAGLAHTPDSLAPARLEMAPDLIETPLRFGPKNRCFGVLTQRSQDRHARAVLILNSGLNNHTGNGRGGVRLARRLASRGVTTLRMDMGGIGESAPRDPMRTVGFHDLARVGDVKAALDVLEEAGHSRVLLTGICSGAYIGLHAAAADGRIRDVVLVNLPYFYVRDEDPAVPSWQQPKSLIVRLLDLTRPLRNALYLERRPMLGGRYFHHRYLVSRVLLALRHVRLSLKQRARDFLRNVLPERWAMSRAERLLRTIGELGVGITLIYSSGDWGLIELGILFSEHGEKLRESHLADVRIIEGADHTMTSGWMLGAYAGIIEEEL